MSETPLPYPGNPEEYQRVVLMSLESRDGVPMELARTIHVGSNRASRSINLQRAGGGFGVSIPLWVVHDLGQGDLEGGSFELARLVGQLDYREVDWGDHDPFYTDVIYPFYGGFEGFVAAAQEREQKILN